MTVEELDDLRLAIDEACWESRVVHDCRERDDER
jgi:hypothetical protein